MADLSVLKAGEGQQIRLGRQPGRPGFSPILIRLLGIARATKRNPSPRLRVAPIRWEVQ